MNMKETLQKRFFRYAAIPSQSKNNADTTPSTEGQWELAKLLQTELKDLGFTDIKLSEFCVLTAKRPARLPDKFNGKIPKVGFVAHLDTVDVNLSPKIHPQIIKNYRGGDLCLNEQKQIYIYSEEHPELKEYIGQDIITGDGTSVLGADNKAAIANIMTAFEEISACPDFYHGDLYVAFVPDEEIGLVGSKHMDFSDFPVDYAYTIDSCALGEVVYETFNAGSGLVTIEGVSAHPMSAKGVLVNPTLIAADFVQMFNRLETPENTEGKEGYIWVQAIESNQSAAKVTLNIRDHNKALYEAKKTYIQEAVQFLQKRYPKARISCEITDVYGNIADAIAPENRACIDHIYTAMQRLQIQPKTIAMRGGTDGSFISTKGIPTPNYFTGAHNFHSYAEFLPLDSFEKSCRMTLELIRLAYEHKAK